MTDADIRNLACAIVLQAAKDFFNTTSPTKKTAILKDLRSSYMDFISNGTSVIVAEKLEKHPEEIAARLRKHHEIGGDQI